MIIKINMDIQIGGKYKFPKESLPFEDIRCLTLREKILKISVKQELFHLNGW